MELPPCNLHRLIIPKTPIPFNYSKCPFWLIVCLHSGVLLILMHSPSHCILKHHLKVPANEQQKKTCIYAPVCGFHFVSGAASHDLFSLSWRISVFFAGFARPPWWERREWRRRSDGECSSFCDFSLLFSRTAQRGAEIVLIVLKFLLVAEFGNSDQSLDRCFWSLWKIRRWELW